MKKSSQNQKRPEKIRLKKPANSVSTDSIHSSYKKRFFRDLALGLIVSVIFFAALEGALRIFGPTGPPPTEDPFVGFSAVQPLFSESNGNTTIARERLRHFNEASFSSVKPANTFRIFAFGGSTTYGHPFNWKTSFPRWLQELLNSCHNGTKYEVINLGGISYASYRILPLMKQTLQYKPDLFVIYTGQNEFLERRSYSAFFEKNPYVLTLEAYLEKSRLYQVMKHLLKGSDNQSAGKAADDGVTTSGDPGKTILQDEASAILDRSSGLDLYHRDDEFAKGVALHFRHNLNALLDLSESAGVPVIFVSPASNLRDFSPFKSEHDPRMTSREKAELDRKLDSVDKMIKSGNFQEALDQLKPVFERLTDHANANFMMAKALDGLGKHTEARHYFTRARDLDICPLRATSPLESEFYSVIDSRNAPLVDFRKFVESRSLESGIASGLAGDESFLDHVHPTIELHQQIAVLIMNRMVETGLVKNCQNISTENISGIFKDIMDGMDNSLLVMRDLNLAKTLKWAGKKDEAKSALKRILSSEENNPEIHKMLGAYALEEGDTREAIARYTRAVQLSGGDPQLKLSLALAFYRSGDRNAARKIYEKMIYDQEATPDTISNLGMLYLEENRVDDALRLLQKWINSSPDANLLYSPYALALAMSGDVKNGLMWMKKASEAEPGDPAHLYNLAGMSALANDSVNCFRFLNLAIDRGYSNYDKLRKDPIFSSVKNNSQFYKILERISE